MKRQTIIEISVFAVLVTLGIALRLYFKDVPNFAPVAALALFSGYYFRSWVAAICVPLTIMAVSDCFVGGYQWYMMATVYGMLALPVLMRGVLRSHLRFRGRSLGRLLAPAAGLVTCSLACSLLFFAVTNFGSWFALDYPRTWAGLAECYAAGVPFFRDYTLPGDMLFAVALFGTYALAVRWGYAASEEKQLAAEAGS